MRFIEVELRVRESGVGNKVSPLFGHCYPPYLPMSSFLETDIRHVLCLGQLGKPMAHRSPTLLVTLPVAHELLLTER